MKEKLLLIRNIIEDLSKSCENNSKNEELIETLNYELDNLEVLADHIDDYDDLDVETWAQELVHIIEEMND